MLPIDCVMVVFATLWTIGVLCTKGGGRRMGAPLLVSGWSGLLAVAAIDSSRLHSAAWMIVAVVSAIVLCVSVMLFVRKIERRLLAKPDKPGRK